MTVVEILRHRARTQPHQLAYTFLENGEVERFRITYAELDRRSRALGGRLLAMGARKERVLLVLDNGPEFLIAFLGALYAGAVAVPAYRPSPWLRQSGLPRLAAIARDSQADFAVAGSELSGETREWIDKTSERTIRWLRADSDFDEAYRHLPRRPNEGDLAFLQYTSGSTARPRGVMVGHDNLLHNLACAARAEGNDDESVSVSWLPFHHDMGLVEGLLQPLYSGYPAYILDPGAFLEKPIRWLRAITRYRATNSGAPNFAYERCARKIPMSDRQALDLSSWRVAYNGAEPVRADSLRAFFEAFAPCGFRWRSFYPVYGLAEATLVVSTGERNDAPQIVHFDRGHLERGRVARADPDRPASVRVGCGRAANGMRIVIAEPATRTRSASNAVGEIWVSGPSAARGYWNRPRKTRRTFHAFLADTGEGPFLRTGDLGFLRDGELFVLGRLKDVLILRGRKYHAQDVEHTVERAHDSVRPGCVAAFDVSEGGIERAVLLAEVDANAPHAEILDTLRSLVLEKQSLRLHVVALVPPRTLFKTSSGKIRRSDCRSAFVSGELPVLAVWKEETATEPLDGIDIRSLVASLARVPRRAIETHLPVARYLDSLGVVELASRLGREVGPTQTLAEIAGPSPTLPELYTMLADSRLPRDFSVQRGAPRSEPLAILLTGATGFLGTYLLAELLNQTTARVFCLVREGGLTDIKRRMLNRALWSPCYEHRIVPVEGDLTTPELGLGNGAWTELSGGLDAIFHNAASVNFVYGYRALRDTNVLGTRRLLELAGQGKAKRFHFVSSLSVCVTDRGGTAAEDYDALPLIQEIGLGYTESKCVAEALVRDAAARGLDASLYRLPLLSAAERTGLANENDFLSRFIRGCVRMQSAPDLDAMLDVCPVDFASRAIVALSRQETSPGLAIHHIRDSGPRHWRELVLFMNLFGYPVRLEPYSRWLARVESEASDPAHPLFHLKAFFSRRVGDTFLLERYEEERTPRIRSERTQRMLSRRGLSCPKSRPSDLERVFVQFIERGVLPPSPRPQHNLGDEDELTDFLRGWVGSLLARDGDDGLDVRDVRIEPRGLDESILTEITSWYAGRGTGLFRVAVRHRAGSGIERTTRMFLKVKPSDREVIDVARRVAELCGPRLGAAFLRFEDQLGFSKTHVRELAVYERSDERLALHRPKLFGMVRNDEESRFILAMEDLESLPCHTGPWRASEIEIGAKALGTIHAFGHGRAEELKAEHWLESMPTATSMVERMELWESLAEHARPWFRRWASGLADVHEKILSTLPAWWPELEDLPHTLVHNDFNPRNVALVPLPDGTRLKAYDWELATLDVPQRDLAELLCFTLAPTATEEELSHYLEIHRRSLQIATESFLDEDVWRRGFGLALRHLIVNRLPMYALVNRMRRRPFLECALKTWYRLFRLSERSKVAIVSVADVEARG